MPEGSNQTFTEDAAGADVKFVSAEKAIAVIFRRTLSVSTVTVAGILVAGLFPILLPLVFLTDFFRRVNFAGVRVLFFLEGFLIMEVLGVLVSAVIWLAELPGRDDARFERRNYALQNWWGTSIARMGIWLFNLRMVVEEPFEYRSKPFILFIRHASFIDTFLSIYHISSQHKTRLRYVLKKELLADPCLDIVGNRIPNVFVDRKSEDSVAQIQAVRRLGARLDPDEGVLIYPEGTRFTRAKRNRIVERALKTGSDELAFASQFESVLPPRLGGPLALLESIPDVDVVFCAHVGFESTVDPKQLLSGKLINAEIRVRFERISGEDIPASYDERKTWFVEHWLEMDRTITHWNDGALNE